MRSLMPQARPDATPARRATGRVHTLYRKTRKTISAPRPWTRPDAIVSGPHALPTRAEMTAATVSV